MNEELNKELQHLHAELTKLKTVSELLSLASNSVSNTAAISEKLLNGVSELSLKARDFIDSEIYKLEELKRGLTTDISILRSDVVQEIQANKETIQSELDAQASSLIQSISRSLSEFKDISSLQIASVDEFSNGTRKEVIQLKADVRRDLSEIIKAMNEQYERSTRGINSTIESSFGVLERQSELHVKGVKGDLKADMSINAQRVLEQVAVVKKGLKTIRILQVICAILILLCLGILIFKLY